MKRLTIAISGLLLASSLAFAQQAKINWLNNQKAGYQEQLDNLQTAKDALEGDQARIDRISTGLPLLQELIDDCQDAELRGDWLEIHARWTDEVESWDRDIASWNERITKAQDKVNEIDRLLAVP